MYRKELSYYFSTPIAYIVIGLYLLTISLFLWVIPGEWNILDNGYATCDGLFALSPWLFILLCPAITMRLYCEEYQTGTWDILRTRPISLTRILLCKYGASVTLIAVALLPTIIHYGCVYFLAEPIGNVDGGAFAGSMVGLFLLACSFLAIGLCASAGSRNQIVAFVIGTTVCFVVYWTLLSDHYNSLSRGVLDFRDLFFYVLVIICFLTGSYVLSSHSGKQ